MWGLETLAEYLGAAAVVRLLTIVDANLRHVLIGVTLACPPLGFRLSDCCPGGNDRFVGVDWAASSGVSSALPSRDAIALLPTLG